MKEIQVFNTLFDWFSIIYIEYAKGKLLVFDNAKDLERKLAQIKQDFEPSECQEEERYRQGRGHPRQLEVTMLQK